MTNSLAKWSPEEDELLRKGMQRYGIKWLLVKKHMRNLRSINSIIKRWHKKIKYEAEMKTVRESTSHYLKVLPELHNLSGEAKREPEAFLDDFADTAWKKNWNEQDDKKLKLLVLQSGIMEWQLLSEALSAEMAEIKIRWKKVIYPKIRQSSKSGGCPKWSILEDKILNLGFKQDISWDDEGRYFLPQRSLGSIQARWRRVAKKFEVKPTMNNKYLARKQCLKRIGRLRSEAASVQMRMKEGRADEVGNKQ